MKNDKAPITIFQNVHIIEGRGAAPFTAVPSL